MLEPRDRSVSRRAMYSGRIVMEDGSPLPVTPLAQAGCTVKVFSNGTFVFDAPPVVPGPARQWGGFWYAEFSAPGFRTACTALFNGVTVRMKRLGEDEGSSVSVTELKVPPQARKEFQAGLRKEFAGKY